MDEFTEPNRQAAKNQGGCLVLFLALLILAGLAMWFYLWGGAAPKTEQPVVPPEKKAALLKSGGPAYRIMGET